MDRPHNPTGWLLATAVALVAGGALAPHPHALVVGGALGAAFAAISALLAWDSRQRRRADRIDAARTVLPPSADPDDGFARRSLED